MRPALVGLLFVGLNFVPGTLTAEPRGRDRDWIGTVVTRISEAERNERETERAGVVTIRVRIDADGVLEGVSVDESSGSTEIDERAIRAVRAAAPFRPPPKRLLSLEGYTELSFPLQVEPGRAGRIRKGSDREAP